MEGISGRTITNKQNVYFTRHAESYGNVGRQDICDSSLTDVGIAQAKLLLGDFDLVICSPLRRALETLHYSGVAYKQLIIDDDFRERLLSPTDQRLVKDKNIISETDQDFWNRVWRFHSTLEQLCLTNQRILLIGHGYYFNGWFRNGCYPNPAHARIIELL